MNFDSRVFFDRIICDVPCSSDAAIRKIPKKWDTWDPNDGACLHPLQLKILIRSLLMLRPNSEDSYLTYSTCSLNPIENEAVVHAALKKLNEDSGFTEFELVDCRNKLLPFRTREGLTKWAVFDAYSKHRRKRSQKERQKLREMKEAKGRGEGEQDDEGEQVDEEQEEKNEEKDCEGDREKNEEEAKEEGKEEEGVYVFEEYFREYKGLEDVPSERQNRFIATNFPPEGTEDEIEEKYHLKRCVRVFPNDQDTSGFFIVLFKRNPNPGLTSNPIQTDEAKEKLKEETKDNQGMLQETIVPVQKTLKNMMRCDPKDPDIEFIVTYYGLSKDFPVDQIFTYSETMNKLVVVNRGLSDVLYADQNKQLSLIAAGAEAFIRNTSKTYSGTECIFRISQNGVNHIYPFMTKRLVYTDLETFLLVVNKKRIELKDLPEGDFKDKVTSLSCGCFVCVTKVNEEQEEAIVLHRHFHHINTMISELNMHKIRTCLNKEF
uniref:SAM-dependent MTase RsmB/NOP-type domain-containing protein n=1 Tax=Euplotes harpa TaxID=151035 RepID=A0A7S3J873_9SPIT|mmetsp:Transcript_2066/g.2607  ORF Transcript_2066/g.2607 Transcript_2066/m.2607 type:complete len:490 (+) Transcript_2066:736-2205(+)